MVGRGLVGSEEAHVRKARRTHTQAVVVGVVVVVDVVEVGGQRRCRGRGRCSERCSCRRTETVSWLDVGL